MYLFRYENYTEPNSLRRPTSRQAAPGPHQPGVRPPCSVRSRRTSPSALTLLRHLRRLEHRRLQYDRHIVHGGGAVLVLTCDRLRPPTAAPPGHPCLIVGAGRAAAQEQVGVVEAIEGQAEVLHAGASAWTALGAKATRCCWATSFAPRPTASSASCCGRIPSSSSAPARSSRSRAAPRAHRRVALPAPVRHLRAIVTERYSELRGRFEVETPTAIAGVRGTSLHRAVRPGAGGDAGRGHRARHARARAGARDRGRARSTSGPGWRRACGAAPGPRVRSRCPRAAAPAPRGDRAGAWRVAATGERAGRAPAPARRRACPVARGAGPSTSPCSRRAGRSRRRRRRPFLPGTALTTGTIASPCGDRVGVMAVCAAIALAIAARAADRAGAARGARPQAARLPLSRARADRRAGPGGGDRRDRRGEPRRGRPLAVAAQRGWPSWSTASHAPGVTAIGLDVVLDQPATAVDRGALEAALDGESAAHGGGAARGPAAASSTRTRSSLPRFRRAGTRGAGALLRVRRRTPTPDAGRRPRFPR